jgi:hypothetical protein
MLQSRRGFLIGAGALLTTAFVKDARSFIRQTSQPLLASPSQVVETMYWHEIPDEGYQLTLGPWSFAPPPPTWRVFFVSEGIPHQTDEDVEEICPLTALNRGILISPSKGATGRTGSTSKVVRSLVLITCSKASISALRATLGADRSSSSTWGPARAKTPIMSTRRTCCRCPFCRRGCLISSCRSRSRKALVWSAAGAGSLTCVATSASLSRVTRSVTRPA